MPKKTPLQKVTLWEGDDDIFANGTVCFTPEFLESILDAYDADDPDVVDDYDDNFIKLRITLRESEYDGVAYFGTVYRSEPKEGGRKKKRGRAGGKRTRE